MFHIISLSKSFLFRKKLQFYKTADTEDYSTHPFETHAHTHTYKHKLSATHSSTCTHAPTHSPILTLNQRYSIKQALSYWADIPSTVLTRA